MSLSIPDKLSFLVLIATSACLLDWRFNAVVIVLLVLLGLTFKPFQPSSSASLRYFRRFLAYSFVLILVLVVVNGLLLREGAVQFSPFGFDLYEGGVLYGLSVSIRLVTLSFSILLFFASTHIQDLTRYLQSIGAPHSLVSIVLLTLFFLEQLPDRISRVFTAQEARGAPVRSGMFARAKSFFIVLSPLILSSIVESVERGTALELRGFQLYKPKAMLPEETHRLHPWGYSFLILSCFVLILTAIRWLSK
jgi:energy-coupling factor transport system permease protein